MLLYIFKVHFLSPCSKVTSKGAGLNPNAKVWQVSVAPAEVPADGPDGAQWPPADVTEGEKRHLTTYNNVCSLADSFSQCTLE